MASSKGLLWSLNFGSELICIIMQTFLHKLEHKAKVRTQQRFYLTVFGWLNGRVR